MRGQKGTQALLCGLVPRETELTLLQVSRSKMGKMGKPKFSNEPFVTYSLSSKCPSSDIHKTSF